MTSSAYAGREPVTRAAHDRPWAADLETEAHAADRRLTVHEAIDAVEQTRAGRHVDLVTHERHGHPSTYLYRPVRAVDRRVELSDEGRCSCGGYVTRVRVEPSQPTERDPADAPDERV
ncbi:CGCGG family rSAM-modified RiPP protein [Halomicrobium salinisoli]|uniref:CGCGG family putative rSAM-modified RiPP protein n=1 Tax=Halomicrobium salinisoli TaxID=2878391 RepID=UPI001CF0C7AF|nr:CGCGG family rSAM-modified RiPP protein [Halomicrobium salinisoli]